MTEIMEMAESLGRSIGRTSEHRTLARAAEAADADREFVELNNELQRVWETMRAAVARGEEPDGDALRRHEELNGKLYALSVYQSLVAAQTNFDKLMAKVDETMREGMRQGASSPILVVS